MSSSEYLWSVRDPGRWTRRRHRFRRRLERQVSALNGTILELQDRNELQKNRMLESEAMLRNFRDDCAATPECARAMRLEEVE